MAGKYVEFAERNLNVVARSGNEWMVRCCFHENEGSPSMQFNVDKGLFVCFSCGEGGGMKKLSRHLGLRYQDPGVDVNDLLARLNTLKSQNDAPMVLTTIPEDTLGRYKFPTTYWGPCTADPHPPTGCRRKPGCPFHRWFTEETVEGFDLGYDPLENAAIIPVRNTNGGLLGVIRRFLDADVDLRYRYPKGFHRASNLFGSWLAEHDDSDVAVLVEGSLDAAAVWQAGYVGLAQYGSSINPAQIRILLRLGIREVVLGYDNDSAGRKADRLACGWRAHKRGSKVVYEYDERVDLTRLFAVRRMSYQSLRGTDPASIPTPDLRIAIDRAPSVL